MSSMTITPTVLDTYKQHLILDTYNRRIKLYTCPMAKHLEEVTIELEEMAKQHECDKITIYARQDDRPTLDQLPNFIFEGRINGFFQGEDTLIYSQFLSTERSKRIDVAKEKKVMQVVRSEGEGTNPSHIGTLPTGYEMRHAEKDDAQALADLYDIVFETYPTPMNNPEFVENMMDDDVYFTIIEHKNAIVSACSADVFTEYNAAEMTDCATLPEHRGKGLLSHQFTHLEKKMEQQGVQSLFSLTRAVSIGMNLINARQGYTYGGTLIQNSNISGRFEDLNIWYKTL